MASHRGFKRKLKQVFPHIARGSDDISSAKRYDFIILLCRIRHSAAIPKGRAEQN